MKLVIAEKPSVARAIAPVLGAMNRHTGYTDGNGYYVSWCFGHLVQQYLPDDYGGQWAERPWSFDVLPMLPEKWKFKIGKGCEEQFGILKKLLLDGSVTEVICATDADREGECIFRYVYGLSGCRKPVKRLWVSSLEESAIRDGFSKLRSSNAYDNLYQAGYCRAKADWLIGMNGSRLFSIRYRSHLNLGRVQTPTLAMIVQRDYEVEHFVKRKYFTVVLDCGKFTAESEQIDDESKADALVQACTGQTAVIADVRKDVRTEHPPKLYDLTTLQRDANKYYGYTAKQTLDAAQELYEAKLITYPRTDSEYLTDNLEQSTLDVTNQAYAKYPQFGVSQAINVKRCVDNKKVTGHHAIIPTKKIEDADLSQLPETQQHILFLIVARLILATAQSHKYESTKVTVRCADTDFTASGRMVIESGWKALSDIFRASIKTKDAEDEKDEKTVTTLPDLAVGQQFPGVKASKADHWTEPPRPYTDATLLSAMERAGNEEYDSETEKKGIGTPATRAVIIEGLIKAEYVRRKGKHLTATDRGVNLIAVVPDTVKSPKLTAEWEMQLQQIERGKTDAVTFMGGIIAYVRALCTKYSELDASVSFESQPSVTGKCPHCGSEVRKGQYGYYCSAKCGMNLAKVYGKILTDNQIMRLLSGKETSFTAAGKKTIILPEAVNYSYNGRTGWKWKTKRG